MKVCWQGQNVGCTQLQGKCQRAFEDDIYSICDICKSEDASIYRQAFLLKLMSLSCCIFDFGSCEYYTEENYIVTLFQTVF